MFRKSLFILLFFLPIFVKAKNVETTYYVDKYYTEDKNKTSSIYLGDLHLADVVDGKVIYVLSDHLNSVNLEVSENGKVKKELEYLPFGQTDIVGKGFTDQVKDEETNFNYLQNRYYDSSLGNFLSTDPLLMKLTDLEEPETILAQPQRLNSYSYALNNPVSNVDTTGEVSLKAWLLRPVQTFLQVSFWQAGMMGYLRPKGLDISANFLQHSLSLNPQDIYVRENNSHDYIIAEIKRSEEFNNYLGTKVAEAEKGGFHGVYLNTERSHVEPLTFTTGDLYTAFHDTRVTRLVGEQSSDGNWNFSVTLKDVYDFHYKDYQSGDFPARLANNLAAPSHLSGALSSFIIDIEFDYVYTH